MLPRAVRAVFTSSGREQAVVKAVVDPVLGPFEWDDRSDFLQGQYALPAGRLIELHIPLTLAEHAASPDQQAVFVPARKVLGWLSEWEERARRDVAEKMVGLYNKNWSREPEDITAGEFARRIELVAVSAPSDGTSFELIYNDGDMEMFLSHQIGANFDMDRRLLNVGL
jgi:hypothetical protein